MSNHTPTLEDLLRAGDGILSTFEKLVAATHDQDGMEILSERAAVSARSFLKKLRAIRFILHNDNDPEFFEVAERLVGKDRDAIGAAIEVVKDLLFWADGATWPDPNQLDSQGPAIEELGGNDLYEKLIDAASDGELLTEDDPIHPLLPDRYTEAMEGLRELIFRTDIGVGKGIVTDAQTAAIDEFRPGAAKRPGTSDDEQSLTHQPDADRFFSELASKRRVSQERHDAQIKRSGEASRRGLETEQALERMAHGTEEKPIGVRDRHITISNRDWAELIVDAAKKWLVCPGNVSLDDPPFPGKGLGFEAARKIWDLALGGSSIEEISSRVDQARRGLGPWTGTEPGCDSELGIWSFFQQLYRYFDRTTWSPPKIGPIEAPLSDQDVESGTNQQEGKPPLLGREPHGARASHESTGESEKEMKPWKRHRKGGLPLRGWAAFAEAVDAANDRAFQDRIRRDNDATEGPIKYVGKIPEADKGELVAWVEDIAARAEAQRKKRESDRAAGKEIEERDGARAQDKAMQIRKRRN